MKKVLYYLSFCLILFTDNSCSDLDNYDAPSETVKGVVVDKNTQKPIQTEIGNSGIRIKMMELSWSETPNPYYFTTMQNGNFNNTKIFKGMYNIVVQGPFVPLVEKDAIGNVIKDESQTVDVKGTVDLKFSVEPFLNIEWVSNPVVNGDGSISVQAKITRGTSNPNYQQVVRDVWLYINSSSYYVGNNNYDARYSPRLTGTPAANAVGTVITLTTIGGKLPGNRPYYLRVGARTTLAVEGTQRYNYNEPISFDVP